MTETVQSPYTHEQILVWLKGLLAIAWADGHFDHEEKELIASLTETELAPELDLDTQFTLLPEDLAAALGNDSNTAENFLRTAVMVAIADGTYSPSEDALLQQYCSALGLETKILESLRQTLTQVPDTLQPTADGAAPSWAEGDHYLPVLSPVQEWLDKLEIHDPRLARFLCKMIPPQCPFERDVTLFGHKIVHIPPMCKLNPLYDQLVGLRFRALSYLADDCKEDVSQYY